MCCLLLVTNLQENPLPIVIPLSGDKCPLPTLINNKPLGKQMSIATFLCGDDCNRKIVLLGNECPRKPMPTVAPIDLGHVW
jgi:hypothetical protein